MASTAAKICGLATAFGCLLAAARGDSRCLQKGGSCGYSCSGTTVSGLCKGTAARRCCLPSADNACTSRRGVCSYSCTSGSRVSGLCGGPSWRRCCLPKSSVSGQSQSTCQGIEIISRSQWNARPARQKSSMRLPVNYLFIHHTDSPSCSDKSSCSQKVRAFQNYHMITKGWSDIGYNFLIGGDGRVYEGRGWPYAGAHTYGYNSISVAISMIGDFTSALPTYKAQETLRKLITCAEQANVLSSSYRLFGHRQAGCTTCPGNRLFNWIKGLPKFSNDKIKRYC